MEKKFLLEAVNSFGEKKLYDICIEAETNRYNPRKEFPRSDCFITIQTENFSYTDFDNDEHSYFSDLKKSGKTDKEIINSALDKYGDEEVTIKPIHCFNHHAGLILSLKKLPDIFDSGIAGYLLVFKNAFKDEQSLENSLENQITELNEYFSGDDIYSVKIFDRENQSLAEKFSNVWDYGKIREDKSDILERIKALLYSKGFSEMIGFEANSKEGLGLIAKYEKAMPPIRHITNYEDYELELLQIGDCYALYNYSDKGHRYYFPVPDLTFTLASKEMIYENEILDSLDYEPANRIAFFDQLAKEKPEDEDEWYSDYMLLKY